MKKVFLLSAAALLSLSLIATSCGPTDTPTSEPAPSESTTEPTPSTETSTEPLPELTVALAAEKTELDIGEDVKLTATITNNHEELAAEITSSDPTIASIVTKESLQYVHGIAPGTATITLTVGTKTATVDVTVKAATPIEAAPALEKITADLTAAATAEETGLKTGTIHEVTSGADGNVTQDDTHAFDVHSDGRVEIRTTKAGTKASTLYSTYKIVGTDLIAYQTETIGEETKSTSKTAAKHISATPTNAEISQADAEKYVTLIDTDLSLKLDEAGIANDLWTNTISKAKIITDETKNTALTLTTLREGEWKVTSTGDNGYKFADIEFTYSLQANGLLDHFKYEIKEYLKASGERGDLSKTYSIEATLTGGEREATPADAFDFNGLYYTDYVLEVYDSKYGKGVVTEGTVGDIVYPRAKSGEPATASKKIDQITVKSISPADAGTITEDKLGVELTKAVDALTITTVSAKGIEKTATIAVKDQTITEIYTEGLEGSLNINEAHEFYVTCEPYALTFTAELVVEVIQGEGTDAEVTLVSPGTYSITCSVAGTVTLKITSPIYVDDTGAALAYEQEVVFIEAPAEGVVTPATIATGLVTDMWEEQGGTGANAYQFTQTPDQEGTAAGYFTFYHNEMEISGSFIIIQAGESLILQGTPDDGCPLTDFYITFGWDEEAGTANLDIIEVSGFDSNSAEVAFVLERVVLPTSLDATQVLLTSSWKQQGAENANVYTFTQTPDQEGTATGYFTFVHDGLMITGSFEVTDYYGMGFNLYAEADTESALTNLSFEFGYNEEDSTYNFGLINCSGTNAANENVSFTIEAVAL